MVTFLDVNARVVGEQALDSTVDIGGNRRLPALVNGDRANRLKRGFDGLTCNFGRLNVGQSPLGRFNLHRQLVEIGAPSAGSRHQGHAANRAAPGSRLANLRMHRAGEDRSRSDGSPARSPSGGANPSQPLGDSHGHDECHTRGQEHSYR